MKAASRPFKSKYDSGRCAACKFRIAEGDTIARLEVTVSWTEEEQSYGKAYLKNCYADYVHHKCLEERNEDETE